MMSSGLARSQNRRRARFAAIAAIVVAIGLSGCSASTSHSGTTAAATPLLADVTPVADPKVYEGPSTAVAQSAPLDPMTDGEQQLPVTITDAQGTSVTVTDASRILALDLYGSLSRIVYELGLGDNVVGRDISSSFAEIADKPLVTHNGHDLSAEAILDVAPTVILTDTSLGPWDVILQLRDAGVPVVVTDSRRSIEGVGTLTQQVADGLGVTSRGQALAARTQEQIDAKVAQIAAVAPATDGLRMVFLYVRGQSGVYYLFGSESGADTLITALGGVDVAGEIGWKGMRPITDEAIVAANPDLILMMTDGLESAGGVDGLLERLPALAQTSAGQHRRFVDMADSTILSFGPHTADVLDALAVAVYAPEDAQ